MNSVDPNTSTPDSIKPDEGAVQRIARQPAPVARSLSPPKNYFELRLRIRFWWLWMLLVMVTVVYPMAVVYTMFAKQYNDTHGPSSTYQKQWEATGCPERLKAYAKAHPMGEWEVKHTWTHLLMLDDSHLSQNNQEILNDPVCLGAKVALLVHKPGAWRYDIVDATTQTIIVSVTPGK